MCRRCPRDDLPERLSPSHRLLPSTSRRRLSRPEREITPGPFPERPPERAWPGRRRKDFPAAASQNDPRTRLQDAYIERALTLTARQGMIHVDPGEQGCGGPVVHRVLGQGLQPGRHRRARRPRHPFEYSLHEPLRGRDAVRAFAEKFRAAFPDLNFWGTAGLIAEGDYVVGQWEGGGTHTGEAFDDMPIGSLPAATGKTMQFTATTVLKVENGRITEEVGLDDGVTALRQLGLINDA